MTRIIAVALFSIAAPFAFAACDDPTMPTSPPPDAQPFVDLYLGTLTGAPAPGEHEVGRSPLDEMLGGAK